VRIVLVSLVLAIAAAGRWLTHLEPLAQYEVTLRRMGEIRLRGSIRFATDARGAIRTADLGALFL